mmetsp:Transcript_7662/g.13495  ORF Transcript_7662/g.13495 Transcript_7662/m.13495 type:complete len:198 (+) Transcript_7662:222-815(+)|eukprot:CAMPEP_0178845136 /NCGR_PEP_ID=MMETSP0746-20121128/17230_1 /TAXON_ID=913974 /ORGANISM="Nitzschia punctata, Strain CCMP561" /LENGTH=197 /DNA_ID=CAMNT_0020509219 /DNA_START=88 /DNA_END=681 /DNA_ORIENTATION=+
MVILDDSYPTQRATRARNHTSLLIADLAKLLQLQVELEHKAAAAGQQQHQGQRNPLPAVEIVGMDVLTQALSFNTPDDTDEESSYFSGDSVRKARNGKRRCRFRNRQNIGSHLRILDDSAGDLSTDSLELARRSMEKKNNETTKDQVALEEIETDEDDVLVDEVLVRDPIKPSLFMTGLAIPDASSMRPTHYGNAAA